MEKAGKTVAIVGETIAIEPKENSVTLKKNWKILGAPGSSIAVETISLNNPKLAPSWMQAHFKSSDGKEEYNYRAVAQMNGKFKDFEGWWESRQALA